MAAAEAPTAGPALHQGPVQTAPANVPAYPPVSADQPVAAHILDVGQPMSASQIDAEVHVLGLPMQDPAILKATQMVFALIWVEVFFFCEYVAYSLASGVVNPVVFVIFLSLPLCGYFGIMYNSQGLLRCFACLALLQALLWTVISVLAILILLLTEWADDSLHQDAEHLVLLVFLSASYCAMTYYGCFLAEKVRGGVILPSKRQNQADYLLMGMQMMDMQILQEVQNLLNGSWLVTFFSIYLAVAFFDNAVYSVAAGDFVFFFLYCIFFGLMACMVHSAYMGVKKNSTKLLTRSSSIGAAFSFTFTVLAFAVIAMCGGPCFHEWFLLFYIAFAFFWAAAYAWKLKGRVESGATLTRNVSEPARVSVGTIMAGQQAAVPLGQDPVTATLQQDGVVMGRALTEEAPRQVATETKPPPV